MAHDISAITSLVSQNIKAEALAGLLGQQKTLPPKLLYDEEGCRLFGRITELPEYYLTRTERQLLETVAPGVASTTPPGAVLVEYGASDESKAEFLLRERRDPAHPVFDAYLAIDGATEELEQARIRLGRSYPYLDAHVLTADFSCPIVLPRVLTGKPRLGFFPGSTIGNFDPLAAKSLMTQIRETLGQGARLLVGVDLRKDPGVLLPAYNDGAGVTATFNRNLLVRLNREAGADFEVDAFSHSAIWNDRESRIEMHLVSRCDQVAHIAGMPIRFTMGETIHTENSYKHTEDSFVALAHLSGWRVCEVWTDGEGLFSIYLLET